MGNQPVLPHNSAPAAVWSTGGAAYEAISVANEGAVEHCIDRLDPRPGERILDVATGTGLAARRAAARGARVTGVDIAPGLLEAARSLAAGLQVELQQADCEALPFPDASFDGVLSTFGVMFCSRPAAAADELVRVCRPGGRIALATWLPEGLVPDVFRLLDGNPAPSGWSPFDWGRTAKIVELFGEHCDVGFEQGTAVTRAASGRDVWNTFSAGFGPLIAALERAPAPRRQTLEREFIALHERYRTGLGILVPRQYLITVARRREAAA